VAKFRIKRTRDTALIADMRAKTLLHTVPLTEQELRDGVWWIVTDEEGPCAYAGVWLNEDGAVDMLSSGVLPRARGNGLQRKLLRHRIRWGRRAGFECFTTYCATHNWRSMNNIVSVGFRIWQYEYSEEDGAAFLHFRLDY
jgi:GNAT superfamily N-acetyltransferase